MAIRQELLDELRKRREEALACGGLDKIAKRHEKGLLGARERIDNLFDAGSFQESGMHANQ